MRFCFHLSQGFHSLFDQEDFKCCHFAKCKGVFFSFLKYFNIYMMSPDLNLDPTLNKPGPRQATENPMFFGFTILGNSRGCGAPLMFFLRDHVLPAAFLKFQASENGSTEARLWKHCAELPQSSQKRRCVYFFLPPKFSLKKHRHVYSLFGNILESPRRDSS